MTTESSKNGALSFSCDFLWICSTCVHIQLNAYYCMLFSSRVRIRFSVWLVSVYAHVFVLLSVVIVTLPFYGCSLVLTFECNIVR